MLACLRAPVGHCGRTEGGTVGRRRQRTLLRSPGYRLRHPEPGKPGFLPVLQGVHP